MKLTLIARYNVSARSANNTVNAMPMPMEDMDMNMVNGNATDAIVIDR